MKSRLVYHFLLRRISSTNWYDCVIATEGLNNFPSKFLSVTTLQQSLNSVSFLYEVHWLRPTWFSCWICPTSPSKHFSASSRSSWSAIVAMSHPSCPFPFALLAWFLPSTALKTTWRNNTLALLIVLLWEHQVHTLVGCQGFDTRGSSLNKGNIWPKDRCEFLPLETKIVEKV